MRRRFPCFCWRCNQFCINHSYEHAIILQPSCANQYNFGNTATHYFPTNKQYFWSKRCFGPYLCLHLLYYPLKTQHHFFQFCSNHTAIVKSYHSHFTVICRWLCLTETVQKGKPRHINSQNEIGISDCKMSFILKALTFTFTPWRMHKPATNLAVFTCAHKHTRIHTHTRFGVLRDRSPTWQGATALKRDRGWRAWIKITINRIKKNKYLAIIEAEWFIPHFHSSGWTAAPKKSICNYRHPTLGRSSPSIHLPPPAPRQHCHPQNKCQNSTWPMKKKKK